MPINENELQSFVSDFLDLDVAKIESIDALKSSFDTTFARKETYKAELSKDASFINPLIGKRLGSIETKIRQASRDKFSLDVSDGDFKDKPIEELIDLMADKAKVRFDNELTDLKSKVGTPSAELEARYLDQMNLLKAENTTWKSQAEKANSDFDLFKTNLVTKQREDKLSSEVEKAFASIKYAPEADELRKAGFRTKILSDVQFSFDENDKFSIFDKDGKTLFQPNKSGVQYSPDEFLRDKAIEYKMYQLNSNGGQPASAKVATDVEFKKADKFIHPSANF